MKEKRVYLVDLNEVENADDQLCPYDKTEYDNLPDDHFIDLVERIGSVYSLEGFATAYDNEELSPSDVVSMRIIEVEIEESESNYDKKSDLIKACINQIGDDIHITGDVDALYELLRYIPNKNLMAYLPEEEWSKYE